MYDIARRNRHNSRVAGADAQPTQLVTRRVAYHLGSPGSCGPHPPAQRHAARAIVGRPARRPHRPRRANSSSGFASSLSNCPQTVSVRHLAPSDVARRHRIGASSAVIVTFRPRPTTTAGLRGSDLGEDARQLSRGSQDPPARHWATSGRRTPVRGHRVDHRHAGRQRQPAPRLRGCRPHPLRPTVQALSAPVCSTADRADRGRPSDVRPPAPPCRCPPRRRRGPADRRWSTLSRRRCRAGPRTSRRHRARIARRVASFSGSSAVAYRSQPKCLGRSCSQRSYVAERADERQHRLARSHDPRDGWLPGRGVPIASITMTSVTEPAAEHEIDIHTTAGKLADLRKRSRRDPAPGRRGRGREDPRQGQADRP